MNNPRVSVITVCYNAEKTIADTVRSVLGQDYNNIEYIIIDGASSDGTLSVIKSFVSENIRLLSEKDNGLYDALNKGLRMATGNIIGILHADDYYASTGTISWVAEQFAGDKAVEALSSSVNIFKPGNLHKVYRAYDASRFRPWQFRIGMQPPHPGFFISRGGLEKAGEYSTTYRISGDFDWLLRAICVCKLKVVYSSVVTVCMRDGGMSSSGMASKRLMNRENLKVLRSHGISSNLFIIYLKYFLKVFQLRF